MRIDLLIGWLQVWVNHHRYEGLKGTPAPLTGFIFSFTLHVFFLVEGNLLINVLRS